MTDKAVFHVIAFAGRDCVSAGLVDKKWTSRASDHCWRAADRHSGQYSMENCTANFVAFALHVLALLHSDCMSGGWIVPRHTIARAI